MKAAERDDMETKEWTKYIKLEVKMEAAEVGDLELELSICKEEVKEETEDDRKVDLEPTGSTKKRKAPAAKAKSKPTAWTKKKREAAARANMDPEGWTSKEQLKLFECIFTHGSHELDYIQSQIPTKNGTEIDEAIAHYKKKMLKVPLNKPDKKVRRSH